MVARRTWARGFAPSPMPIRFTHRTPWAHLDVESVAGDWRPFVEYLGRNAKAG